MDNSQQLDLSIFESEVNEQEQESAKDQVQEEILVTEDIVRANGAAEVVASFIGASGATITITRKAWAGKRKPKSDAFHGVRRALRASGFEITNSVQADGGSGRLQSAVYSDGEHTLNVEYGAAENYGHKVTVS